MTDANVNESRVCVFGVRVYIALAYIALTVLVVLLFGFRFPFESVDQMLAWIGIGTGLFALTAVSINLKGTPCKFALNALHISACLITVLLIGLLFTPEVRAKPDPTPPPPTPEITPPPDETVETAIPTATLPTAVPSATSPDETMPIELKGASMRERENVASHADCEVNGETVRLAIEDISHVDVLARALYVDSNNRSRVYVQLEQPGRLLQLSDQDTLTEDSVCVFWVDEDTFEFVQPGTLSDLRQCSADC